MGKFFADISVPGEQRLKLAAWTGPKPFATFFKDIIGAGFWLECETNGLLSSIGAKFTKQATPIFFITLCAEFLRIMDTIYMTEPAHRSSRF